MIEMAGPGYLGYGLKAGVEGFKTGFGMGQQKQEMEWQKKQKKKLEETEAKLEEEAVLYNSVVTQLGADGFYSEDDMMKIEVTYLALGYLTQERLKGAHDALLTMDKNAFDREIDWFDRTIDLLKSGLLDPKDATAVFEYGRENWATSEKVRNLYEAADNIYARTHGELKKERVYEQARIIPSERRVPFIEEELGIEMPEAEPKAPTMADERSAIILLRTFLKATPEQFEAQRTRIEQRSGLDLSIYTQDILREEGTEFFNLYDTPEEVMSNVTAPAGLTIIPKRDTKTGKYYASFSKKTTTPTPGGFRATSLSQQEKYKQDALDANTWIEAQGIISRYSKAGFDPSEMPTDQDWINGKFEELDSHIAMLKEITDEEGKLQGNKKFKFMSGDKVESQTGVDWYKDIYEAYIFYLDELRKMGIDVSRFPKIKLPGEIKKAFLGKYPSIYSTETVPTPTPTETEIPKLPYL
ncbi:hypothetical protein ES702_03099 [subsurface metagenome]